MNFPLHTPETAPAGSREPLRQIERRYGFLPNLAAAFAESPATLAALLQLLGAYDAPAMTLAPLQRQIVLLTTSLANGCDYCIAAHSMLASKAGLARPELVTLQQGGALSDPALEALRRFTHTVVESRGNPTPEDLAAFETAGFTSATVLEVVLGVALKTLTNYVNHIVQTPVNEAFLAYHPTRLSA